MSKALLYCAGGGIGDSLVSSVVARALKSRYAQVDALTLPHHQEALACVPEVNEILLDTGAEEDVVQAIRSRNYDAVVVTWATARTARIAAKTKIPIRVGQARRLYSSSFTHRVTVKSELGDVVSPWVQIQLDYARAIGCDTVDDAPRFLPKPKDEATAVNWLLERNIERFVILHPTNAIATTRGIWPTKGWSALAAAMRERFGAPVVLSGSQADARILTEIAEQSGAIPVYLGLGAFGALAQRSLGFCGITTGSMHIAAAVGAPTLGIFPFQSDVPDRWGPCSARSAVVRASFRCHRGDTKEKCKDYACIAGLDVPRILAAFAALIDCAKGPGLVYSSS